jgi:hypothetical protein
MSLPDQQSVCTIAISSSRKEKPLPALGRSTLGRWLDPRELDAAVQRGRHRRTRCAPARGCVPPRQRFRSSCSACCACAAVELDGRWTLMDASFTVPALRLMADSLPAVRPWVHRSPRPAAPHSMAHALSGVDPLGVEVHPDIDHLMTKRSSHRPEVLEAMNLLLDEAQSRHPSRTHVQLRELAARAPFPALGAAWRTYVELAGPTAPTPASVAA